VGCQQVANMCIGKTVEERREMFKIKNDLTLEEKEAITRNDERIASFFGW